MSILLLICLYFTKIDGAPKLGHALNDPLMYEAMKHGQLEYNNPPYLQVKLQDGEFDSTDDDDFLENSDGDRENLAVALPASDSQNEPRIGSTKTTIVPTKTLFSKTTSVSISETTSKSTTTTERTTTKITQSTFLEKILLRKIVTSGLATVETKAIGKTTIISEARKNEKTIDIARSSCTSCVGKVQNYKPVALRQRDFTGIPMHEGDGGSIKKTGYDYDENVCKIVNGRILCGYNKNIGEIPDDKAISNINGDCRMRDDRIECGYVPGRNPQSKGSKIQRLSGNSLVLLKRLPIIDTPAESLGNPLSEDNTESELLKNPIIKGTSVILTNGVMDSSDSLGYPTINDINSTEADLNMKLNQTIPEVSLPQNDLKLETVTATISATNSVDTISRSYAQPVNLTSNYVNSDLEPTTLPQFPDSPDIIDYVTTVNESVNFVTEPQGERRRVEGQGVQSNDPNEPSFNNYDEAYRQNSNSIKEENEPHVEITTDASNYKQVTRCVEIGDRIVCYNIKLRDITPHM